LVDDESERSSLVWQSRLRCPDCEWSTNLMVWADGAKCQCPNCGSDVTRDNAIVEMIE
jgi:uncharacterized paraquat-inducible protein A